MLLNEILRGKGSVVHTIGGEDTLADVVDKLVEHNCGSLVVCDENEKMIGIITERDILKACAAKVAPLGDLIVAKYMTTSVHTGSPKGNIDDTMGLLTEKRIRHLPILDDEKLVGMISIGDLVKARYNQLSVENHHLKNYIQS